MSLVGQTLQLLLSFVTIDPNGNVDASGMFSSECYELWASRKPEETRANNISEAFRKGITAHGKQFIHTL